MNLSIVLLFFSGTLAIPQLSYGQLNKADTTKKIEEVLVQGATKAQRVATTLPIVAKVISGSSIEKSGLSRLSEVLQEQTGLTMVPTFNGGLGVQMQGMDSPYIMIMIDGQPMIGRSSGVLDLSRITLQNIDRIEIIKGASSCLYGSEALGGIINIITKSGLFQKQESIDLYYKYARFNTHDVGTNIIVGKEKWNFNIGANMFSSDGYKINPSYATNTVEHFINYTIQPKFNYKLSERLVLKLSSRYYHQKQDYQVVGTDSVRYTGDSKIKEWNPSIIVEQAINDNFQLEYDLYASNYKANTNLNGADGLLHESSDFDQWLYRPEIRAKHKFNAHQLTTGVGITYDELKRTDFSKKEHLSQTFVYSQLEYFLTKRTNAIIGFRYDHHKQYESQFSPKAAINVAVNKNLNIKSSIGYGYKAPDLRQLYLDFTNSSIGYTVLGYNVAESRIANFENEGLILRRYDFDFTNPLKAESSINYNLAANYNAKSYSFDVNLFYNKNKNLINTQIIALKTNGQSVFSYFNIDKVNMYGAESNMSYRISEQLKISLGYQYLISENPAVLKTLKNEGYYYKDGQTMESNRLQKNEYLGLFNRSKHMLNLNIDYIFKNPAINVSLRTFYRSKYGQGDTNANGIYDEFDRHINGYQITDLTLGKKIKNKFLVQIGTNNLFNFKNEDIATFPGTQYFAKIHYSIF